jgi:hypothetical protein
MVVVLKLMVLLLSCCVCSDCWYVCPSVDQRQAPAAHIEIWDGGRMDDGGDDGCWILLLMRLLWVLVLVLVPAI